MLPELDIKKYEISLKESSKNDEGEYLLDDEYLVYNFDKLTEIVGEKFRKSKPMASCDALFIKNDNEIYLIEFKNCKKAHVPKKQLHQKAHDSIYTLQILFFKQYSLEELSRKVTYMCVYNENSSKECENSSDSFDKIKHKLKDLAKCNDVCPVLFNLECFKNTIYNDVITIDKEIFSSDFKENIFGEISITN